MHLAVVLLVLGIVASGAYNSVTEATLHRGQSMRGGRLHAHLSWHDHSKQQNSQEVAARLALTRDGRSLGTLEPGRRVYPVEGRVTNEVDIHTNLRRGDDVYAILESIGANGVTIKALVNPMVGLIWLAGLVFLIGAGITIWPDPREARQLARRYDTALAREA